MGTTFDDIKYIRREICPQCHTKVSPDWLKQAKNLKAVEYSFGGYAIPAHGADRTRILVCPECGLVFKDQVPATESLSKLFAASVGKAWGTYYDYTGELELAKTCCNKPEAAILDIGSSNGDLPRKFAEFYSYVSALDVVPNPACEQYLTGEYIMGLLDDFKLEWSGRLYDFVTVFDVAEHLYDVRQGMANLNKLLAIGGHAIIETGDAESDFPRRYGVENWWYLNLIEHHQAFSEAALTLAAEQAGFSVVSVQRKRHKNKSRLSWKGLLRRAVKSALYRTSPLLFRMMSVDVRQPSPPFERDHLLMLLQKQRGVS